MKFLSGEHVASPGKPGEAAKDDLESTGRALVQSDNAGGSAPAAQNPLVVAGAPNPDVRVATGVGVLPAEVFPAPRPHARYSPSTYKARRNCPGWTQDRDPKKDTGAADRGTLIHDAIEHENPKALHDDFDRACYDKCVNYVASRASRLNGYKRFREVQIPVLDQYGTVDDLIICGSYAEMTDYKTGWRAVDDAEINDQMIGYTVGVFDRFGEIETLRVNILLPRRDEVSFHVFTRSSDYDRLKAQTFKTIESSKAADALFANRDYAALMPLLRPSADNCEFCGRKAECPALQQLATAVATKYDTDLVIPKDLHGSSITDPRMMAQALHIVPVLEKWASGVKAAALAMRKEQGVEIPGHELAERSAARKITNSQAAWETVKTKLSPEEFAECAEVSLPKLETAVARHAERGQKGKIKEWLTDELRDRDAVREEGVVYYLKKTRT
jgi:hypothetical protein